MRQAILVAITIALFIMNIVSSQPATITLLCLAEKSQDSVTLDDLEHVLDMDGYCHKELLTQLKQNLQTHDISLSIVQQTSDIDFTNIRSTPIRMISILDSEYNPWSVILNFNIEPTLFRNSTMLNAHMSEEIGVRVTNDNDILASSNLLTGIVLFALDRCSEAELFLNEATQIGFYTESGETNYWSMATTSFYRANCAILEDNFLSAEQIFEEAFPAEYGQNALIATNLQANLAWVYWHEGKQTEALDLMNRTVTMTSSLYGERSRINALRSRAQLYAMDERYDDAIADLSIAIDTINEYWLLVGNRLGARTLAELHILRGQMYLYLYEWDSSLADYNRAIELDPDYADAYYYRAVLYYSILQTGVELRAEALADFQHYLELAPDGDHAADAARYIEQIETELEALNS